MFLTNNSIILTVPRPHFVCSLKGTTKEGGAGEERGGRKEKERGKSLCTI